MFQGLLCPTSPDPGQFILSPLRGENAEILPQFQLRHPVVVPLTALLQI